MAVMLTNPLQVKDSRWLTLEVCREFTRNKCTRSETECKFAHPPPHVEVQNGRVTCCFDSIKGKCQRKDPPCKYLHPPQHLREQLLQNGRNNLILKNLQMQAIASSQIPQMVPLPPVSHQPHLNDKYRLNYGPNYQDQGQVLQAGVAFPGAAICSGQYSVHNPYLMQGASVYNPYMGQTMPMASVITNLDQGNQQVPAGMMQANAGNQQKMQRADRLEPSTTSSGSGVSDSWPGSYVDSIAPSSHYSPVYFQGMSNLPTMMPMVKRPAVADSKSGIPMYQPGTGTAAYQQAALAAMQLQQPFVPVTIAGHPPSVPRF